MAFFADDLCEEISGKLLKHLAEKNEHQTFQTAKVDKIKVAESCFSL